MSHREVEWRATLLGGPLDGQIRDMIGSFYQHPVNAKCGTDRFIWAMYNWDTEVTRDRTGYRFIGRFIGYQCSRGSCNKDGRLLPKRKKGRR